MMQRRSKNQTDLLFELNKDILKMFCGGVSWQQQSATEMSTWGFERNTLRNG
jgi:hypothetical protein